MATKFCTTCNTQKSVSQYYVDNSSKDGFNYRCKSCIKIAIRKYPDGKKSQFQIAQQLGHKRCKTCKIDKPVSDFSIFWQDNTDRIMASCKSCVSDRSRLRDTGVTPEQRQSALKEQNGVCKLCNDEFRTPNNVLHTDHCHKTMKFRGMLCLECNHTIRSHTSDFLIKCAEYVKTAGFNNVIYEG